MAIQMLNEIRAALPMAALLTETYCFAYASECVHYLGSMRADESPKAYRGGMWDNVTLGNSHFMALPDDAERVRLQWPDNGCDVETDRVSASAALCLMAFCHALTREHNRGRNADKAIELFYQMLGDALDFAPDPAAVARFID